MKSRDIRKTFTEFFVERGHLGMASSSLVPHNDPTVLLTTAGMQQMTPFFLGLETPPAPRITTIQKCFRSDDIDDVGDDTHNTFFEMLGNFSVGDYFKSEAIDFAWELITEVYRIPKKRLWITVHPEDDFSRAYWRDEIGVPAGRIQDDPTNIWGPVGDSGPCGPNSEIHYDLTYDREGDTGRGPVGPDEDRYLELWNLVFMEFFQEKDGSRRPLPRQNIDTGMGLERLCLVLQGVGTIHETDLFKPIIDRAADLGGVRYGQAVETDRALRIIGDHGRAVSFLIADGVLPGNEGRAYVLRRVLRRAAQQGRKIGIERPFLGEIADVVIEEFSDQYPELSSRRQHIHRVLRHEEEAFGRTLATGLTRFETLTGGLRGRGLSIIPGDEAFRLHDTYGFPIDMTVELAREMGLAVDRDGFEAELERQRERSRAQLATFADAGRDRAELYAALRGNRSLFVGYDADQAESEIVALVGATELLPTAEAGAALELVLAATPFYSESGGQVGDTGDVRTETGLFRVFDTQRPTPDLIVHRGEVVEGFVSVGQTAEARIDVDRRHAIRRNHTATHLLHRVLRDVLGNETRQAGSLVAPDRLRFDFTSLQPLNPEGIDRVTAMVNQEILADVPVEVHTSSYQEAVSRGAMALFGEKYGDIVRVVEVPGFSVELCGGTHVGRTGEIGPVVVLSESSIGSGVRRIEALTGSASLEYLVGLHRQTSALARELRVPVEEIGGGVESLRQSLREREREIESLRLALATADIGRLIEQSQEVGGTRVVAARVAASDRETMLRLADRLRDQIQSGVVVLGAEIDGKPALLAAVTKDQTGRGIHAGTIIGQLAPVVGGRGGGRPEMAQGGGTDTAKLDEALARVPSIVEGLAGG
jgi:alanyl-tRNA synthetase